MSWSSLRRVLWRHGWKLLLLPLFFEAPTNVKYACAAIVAGSLLVDLVLLVRERRQRGVGSRSLSGSK